MKVRIKPYLDKEDRTEKVRTNYELIMLREDVPESGVYVEDYVIERNFKSEKDAEKYAIKYKNDILNREPKDIDV